MNAPHQSLAPALQFAAEDTLPDSQRGLYGKFNVTRTDGSSAPGGKHEHDQHFVLNFTTDKHSIPALAAYAESCKTEYPVLASDLGKIVADYITRADEYITISETTLPNGMVVMPFTVARYIAGQGPANTPISAPNAAPWVEINYHDATEAANKAGLHLITETQWLAIAWQIYNQADNWTGGAVGEGHLYQGLHLGTVSEAQTATYESTKPEERRWHVLANGERIYDFAGNAYQWIFDDVQGASDGTIGEAGIAADSISITTCPDASMSKGTGWRPDGARTGWSGGALVRGGGWGSFGYAGVFRLVYGWPGREVGSIGFRCTKPGL